jgi:hypothetical protein
MPPENMEGGFMRMPKGKQLSGEASAPASSTTEEKQSAMTKAATSPYERKPAEKAAVDAWRARRRARAPSPSIKLRRQGDSTKVEFDHPDTATGTILMMEALGTTSTSFMDVLVRQLINAGTQGREPDEHTINFMLSVVKGIEPRDEIEAMLAAQMATVHMASMTFARQLAHVDTIPQQDSAERTFNKLARTFTTQMEALKRYRTGGEQKVTVEHVTVQAGGQAIVGNVSHAGGGSLSKNPETTS